MIASDSLCAPHKSAPLGSPQSAMAWNHVPDYEVAIRVVNESGYAPVGVELLCEPRRAALALVQVEVDGVIGEVEFLEDIHYFPARCRQSVLNIQVPWIYVPPIRPSLVAVQSELLSVLGHDDSSGC